MNRVILMGNLTRNPEFKNIGTTNVCNFGVAMNQKTQSGQETTFVDVSAFGKTAEAIAKYFTKGKPILIEGRLKLNEWADKTTGQKRSKLKVIAEKFYFCGGNQQDAPQSAPQGESVQVPAVPKSPFV